MYEISDLSSQHVISEGVEESREEIPIDEQKPIIDVLTTQQNDVKFNSVDNMSDASESDNLSLCYGFAPSDMQTLKNVGRILDLKAFLKYKVDPKTIWYPTGEPLPISFRKRNYTARVKLELDSNDTADDQSRSTTPLRAKRRRQK